MSVIIARVAASLAALIAVCLAGCQLKSASAAPGFITADTSTFVIHSIDRYTGGEINGTNSMIVVIKATYTNPDANPETIASEKFQVIDQTLEAVYVGLSGGDIYIPTMPVTSLAPGKSMDVTVGFRVPAAMTNGRLVYRP